MGSVKDLEIIRPPQGDNTGEGRFVFSDRYSVFDWGEMPDHIPGKGESLCLMTAYFFEKLKEKGYKTHYRGIVEDGKVKTMEELENPSSVLEVSLVNVIDPEFNEGSYDYSAYDQDNVNCLIPLEIIYRNTLPEHSSFRKRVENGELDIEDYGLSQLPEPGVFLEKPIYDVSTKLEASDRYISWEEAREIAVLSQEEYREALDILSAVNNLISTEVEKAGMKNLDGKIELAFDSQREIMVVDAIGTPDECRFSYEGFSISKEAVRKYYRGTNWHEQVEKIKKTAGPDWKEKVNSKPEPLPETLLKLVSEMYMACANEVTGSEWFEDIRLLSEIKGELNKFM